MGEIMGNDAQVSIGADATGVEKGMREASAAVKASVATMNASLSTLAGGFSKLQGIFLGMTAVLAGGAAFKSAIDATVKWNGEVVGLSKTLGINTEKAAGLNYALQHLGIESETYTSAADKMFRQLQKNAPAFETLGIKTKDVNGQWRAAGDIMPDVIERLRGIHNTTQMNIAGQQIFGRAWKEVRAILKLTSDELARSAQRAKELNLQTDPTQVRAYKEAMNDLKLISTSLSVQMGNKLMPTLTAIGQVMAGEGKEAADVFKTVLQNVAFVAMASWMVIKDMGDAIGALAAQAMALAHGDLKMAKAIGAERDKQAAKNEADFERYKEMIFNPPAAPKPQGGSQDDAHGLDFSKDGKGSSAERSRMAAWESELAETKAAMTKIADAQGQYREMTATEERAFWSRRIALAKGNSAEMVALSKKLGDLDVTAIRDKYAAQLEALKTEEVAVGNNFAAKRAIVLKEMALYDQNGKQYAAEKKHLTEIDQQALEQQQRLSQMRAEATRAANLEVISVEEETARFQVEMGIKTKEELLQQEQQFEQRRYVIKLQALQDELDLMAKDPGRNIEHIAKLNEQKQELERQHQARMVMIQRQAILETNKIWQTLGDRLGSLWDKGIQAMMNGTLTWRNSMKAIGAELAAWFAKDVVGKQVKSWILGETMKTGATQTGAAARLAAEAGAALKSVALWAAAAIKNIMNSAYQVMASVYNAIAAIPYVGPFLAPAMAVGAFAVVAGYASRVMSAEGGYDIPRGLNPMTQLHQEEMVLPAKQANVIRDMADGGGSGGATIYINTTGGDWIHKKDLAGLLKKMNRNFVTIK